MSLSIVIVNYHSVHLINDCLNTIAQYHDFSAYEFIVVNNGTAAGDREWLCRAHPYIIWIDMDYNAGFARANNEGIRLATGETILLLNPDILCTDNSIARCHQQLVQGEWVAAGVQLKDAAGVPQISGSYFVKGGLNHLLPIPYWGSLIRWLGYRLGSKVPGVETPRAVETVDWISGAFLMVKKAAINKAGLLDEDFFLYGEEVEWCSRLQKAGTLVLFGGLQVIHLEGATINKSQKVQDKGYYNLYDRKGLQLMVSNHLRVRKQYGVFWFAVLLLNYTWGVMFFGICATLQRIVRLQSPIKDWTQVIRYAANIGRLWKLAPTIIRNKPYFYKMF